MLTFVQDVLQTCMIVGAGSPLQTMDNITLGKQQLRKVRTILTGDSSDESNFAVTRHGLCDFLWRGRRSRHHDVRAALQANDFDKSPRYYLALYFLFLLDLRQQ